MYKPQFWLVPAARYPAVHSAAMTIDAIPHYFTNKASNLQKASGSVKLRHSKRRLIAMILVS
jgi:hypothetical protein